MLEQGAPGQLLAGEGLLGSSALAALVPDGAGSAQGPRALEPGRLLEGEAAEAPPELHCPCRAGRGAARRMARGSPCGADELGDSIEPFFIDVVDGAVAQELVCRDERRSGLHGRAGCARRRTSRGERGSGSAAVSPHGWMLGRCLLLVPRRASGGVDGRRRGTTRAPADGSRLGDAGCEGGSALGAGPTSV